MLDVLFVFIGLAMAGAAIFMAHRKRLDMARWIIFAVLVPPIALAAAWLAKPHSSGDSTSLHDHYRGSTT